MKNGDRIRLMTDEQFADWLEDFAEAYTIFWINPDADFSHRDEDKKIQLRMLRSEYIDEPIEF